MFCLNNVRLQRSGWFMECCMKRIHSTSLQRQVLNHGYVSASVNNAQFKIFGKDRNEQSNEESAEYHPDHFSLWWKVKHICIYIFFCMVHPIGAPVEFAKQHNGEKQQWCADPVLYSDNGITLGHLMLLIVAGECRTLLDESAGGSSYLQAAGGSTISLSIALHYLISATNEIMQYHFQARVCHFETNLVILTAPCV